MEDEGAGENDELNGVGTGCGFTRPEYAGDVTAVVAAMAATGCVTTDADEDVDTGYTQQ